MFRYVLYGFSVDVAATGIAQIVSFPVVLFTSDSRKNVSLA